EREFPRNLFRGQARGDQVENLALATRQSPLRQGAKRRGRPPAHVEREDEHADDRTACSERQLLAVRAPELAVGVDEDGLEVGRLTMLRGTAELRLDTLA